MQPYSKEELQDMHKKGDSDLGLPSDESPRQDNQQQDIDRDERHDKVFVPGAGWLDQSEVDLGGLLQPMHKWCHTASMLILLPPFSRGWLEADAYMTWIWWSLPGIYHQSKKCILNLQNHAKFDLSQEADFTLNREQSNNVLTYTTRPWEMSLLALM